ncbi:hypothetical protein [Sphingosinicella terrae]|uniref:DUF7940 domain-containing protein n=1 Tax=Sphingosinicella terrae TaxID=2172047 RepID=UPI000E0D4CCC|nr:hypothetical protein [Sphingosinicella terrae]
MKAIPDWRRAWRFWSVRLNFLGLVILAAEQALPLWAVVPAEARALLPRWIAAGVPLLCFALAIVARVVRQEKLDAQRQLPRP